MPFAHVSECTDLHILQTRISVILLRERRDEFLIVLDIRRIGPVRDLDLEGLALSGIVDQILLGALVIDPLWNEVMPRAVIRFIVSVRGRKRYDTKSVRHACLFACPKHLVDLRKIIYAFFRIQILPEKHIADDRYDIPGVIVIRSADAVRVLSFVQHERVIACIYKSFVRILARLASQFRLVDLFRGSVEIRIRIRVGRPRLCLREKLAGHDLSHHVGTRGIRMHAAFFTVVVLRNCLCSRKKDLEPRTEEVDDFNVLRCSKCIQFIAEVFLRKDRIVSRITQIAVFFHDIHLHAAGLCSFDQVLHVRDILRGIDRVTI